MSGQEQFCTVRGYALQQQEQAALTDSMEDYVEMLYRLSLGGQEVRLHDLAAALHVRPPSASRMAQKLARRGFLRRFSSITGNTTPLKNEKPKANPRGTLPGCC